MREWILINGLKCFVVGNKIYTVCADCGKLVQVNKPIFGSLHVCANQNVPNGFGV